MKRKEIKIIVKYPLDEKTKKLILKEIKSEVEKNWHIDHNKLH